MRNATPKGAAGRVYGFVYSGLDLGAMLGPVWFGLMLDHGHAREMFFVIGALFVVAIGTVVAGAPRRGRRAPPEEPRWISASPAAARWSARPAKGSGRGCAEALAREGVDVTIVARTAADVERTAAGDRRAGRPQRRVGRVRHHDAGGPRAALAACPQPDILVNNAGGPPPGDFRDWDRDAWLRALDANMLTPIELIKATVDGMIERKFGRIVNITSSAVKAPIDILGLSNGARSGLTGFVAGLARKVARHNVTINNLLPGSFDTDRLRTTSRRARRPPASRSTRFATRRRDATPAGRFGTPREFGAVCAFLCSVHAGYIVGPEHAARRRRVSRNVLTSSRRR